MTANVTVGIDGSSESLAAVEWAAHEAEVRRSTLRILHVEEWPPLPIVPLPSSIPLPTSPSQWSEELLRDAAEATRLRHPQLTVTTAAPAGRPERILLAEANDPDRAELLVLGSRGLNGALGFIVGSISLAVVGAAERPVVLVRAGLHHSGESAPAPSERLPSGGDALVLGLDLQEPAESQNDLLDFGFAEAARRRCALRVVHAWSLPAQYGYAEIAHPGVGVEIAEHITKTLDEILAPWRQRFPAVSVSAKALVGVPGAQLVYESADADLLVVGRRKPRVPVGPRLGHVAQSVIHHATMPVVVVPHE
ncbi:universal stress protein [Streptomyces niveus]|uniref:universal stress protein n=1 Tax=Streptomyces niveus TaxID=193462 RepID=UPI00084C960C|nr:universal stress protein [Streptomyces niveus]